MNIKELILLTLSLATTGIYAQTPVDTTLTLSNIDILGRQLTGLSGSEIKRLQVENNLSSQTNTTAEALRQLPSVITDIEGAVYFRGSDRTTLLLNGIPYGLLEENSGDVLIQLPALFFNQISVSTYPPIHLVPEGDAGIINLSPARKNPLGSPLQLTLGAGYHDRYNAGAVFNLTPGKFNITGKYDYRREYRKRSFEKTTTDNTGVAEMRNNASARPDIHTADLNVDYLLSDNDIISVYGLYHLNDYSRYGGINNKKLNPAGEVMNHVIRHRYNDQRQQAYAAEARWLHRFSNPADQLKIVFNYNNFTYDEGNHYKNQRPDTEIILAEDSMYITQEKRAFTFRPIT
ncbi:MAG: hypothetical protein LUD74_04290 [Tannerellaceae bacterium]|nr:hypothetical protein [Tannerellaceae bacterium]